MKCRKLPPGISFSPKVLLTSLTEEDIQKFTNRKKKSSYNLYSQTDVLKQEPQNSRLGRQHAKKSKNKNNKCEEWPPDISFSPKVLLTSLTEKDIQKFTNRKKKSSCNIYNQTNVLKQELQNSRLGKRHTEKPKNKNIKSDKWPPGINFSPKVLLTLLTEEDIHQLTNKKKTSTSDLCNQTFVLKQEPQNIRLGKRRADKPKNKDIKSDKWPLGIHFSPKVLLTPLTEEDIHQLTNKKKKSSSNLCSQTVAPKQELQNSLGKQHAEKSRNKNIKCHKLPPSISLCPKVIHKGPTEEDIKRYTNIKKKSDCFARQEPQSGYLNNAIRILRVRSCQ